MADTIMGRLKKWAQRLTAPDEPNEPGMDSLDEKTASILNRGTQEAGEFFEEEPGFTPEDNHAIVFVDPKLLGDEEKEDTSKEQKTSHNQGKKVVDDDTFDTLEREEEELDDKERETRHQG